MSSDIAIKVSNVSKVFETYEKPQKRLQQFILRTLSKAVIIRPLKAYFLKKANQCSKKFKALDEISFEVKKGQTVGIIGRNGSGKSTLLQIICGTLNPTHGEAYINGRVAALLELGSGFNPDYTGRENVYLNGQLYGLTLKQIDERFEKIVGFADIGDFIEQPTKTYSSGMMVRLAFAVIAHVDADVLVVDEALAVGDAFFTQKCMRFLREFMKTGTILFVSHDTGSVRNLCSYAIWLEKGSVIQEGLPKVVSEFYLEAFYEAQQGKGTTTKMKPKLRIERKVATKDQRLDFINTTQHRNDLQIFEFNHDSSSFGLGTAQIVDVSFTAADGEKLIWLVGGELVTVSVLAVSHQVLKSPIVGFYIKDRLGQTLFGDNSYLSYIDQPVEVDEECAVRCDFTFYMPILPKGDYSICVALAEGTQEEHVQMHWIHDALFFKSESTSASTGLIGIPMQEINMALANIPEFDNN
ncbi:ABC transporter ATP-binding protein [Pseudomonas sp. 5P_3.1_Bac2]|uniref:ABC transporter ATP-binding protein n=1 Tax=Pseudomonas sp. 5P_3.1_Bac2 TaxID=2971617 RepID=UPI0021C7AA46|nr:ABC transporter ATP-binding protein [Pseudomonas sp. 5P_3.1_Bac2]MCU1719137.1 ABC transporter ATP-binding protein [Pseudomonas sp. 5P_3.1_Bac2]